MPLLARSSSQLSEIISVHLVGLAELLSQFVLCTNALRAHGSRLIAERDRFPEGPDVKLLRT